MRLVTAPVVRNLVAGTWSIYWNGLVDGARPRPAAWAARGVEAVAARLPGPSSWAGPPAGRDEAGTSDAAPQVTRAG